MSAEWTHVASLRSLVQVFPLQSLRVLHYDSAKSSLLMTFFKALGLKELNPELYVKKFLNLNQGLSEDQRSLLILMNREYQNKQQPFQKDIIKAISQSPSRGRAEKPEISCKTLNALTQKFIGEKD